MTIVFFARRFYPLIGGVEKHVFEISKRLVMMGHKVIIITEELNNRHPEFISGSLKYKKKMLKQVQHDIIKDISIYRINVGKENGFKKFRIWKELWKLRSLIRDADIVHCHDVFFWYLPFRFLFPKKHVYTTFHGYESYPISYKAVTMRKISERLSWGNICIGDFIKKWYGTRATYVSYGAVDMPKMKDLRFKIQDKESAVFIGRLDEQTGILAYVKAVEKVREKYPKFSMTAVGDGEYKNKIANKVNVVGFQNNTEKYLENAHFAFVSRYLAILEAFAARRLVFAVYDNPVKEDYLRLAPFAKYIIISETPEELSKKIYYYLEHPDEEKKLIENAFQWAQGQSWIKMVDLYMGLWKGKRFVTKQ